jgi:2-oxoisovalerate dehydrogenase E1 component alpha subunit
MNRFCRRFFSAKTTISILARPQPISIPTFQLIDTQGKLIDKSIKFDTEELSVYKQLLIKMLEVELIESTLLKAKFHGAFSFFMTSFGETGAIMGSAAACAPQDAIFSQYREFSSLYWRGFTLEDLTDNLLGNDKDIIKGRQMPIHFSDSRVNFFSVSSPLATNIPQAAGWGYGLSQKKKNEICINYFGDGAASEGDFYAGINFAQTLGSQTLFFCRNNGWAISTPISEQTSGDGLLPKAMAFGMEAARVDGNDPVAVYRMTKAMREYIVKTSKPAFIEAMTYRCSDHSTTDKSTKYRPQEEIDQWTNENNPIKRLKTFLHDQGVIQADFEDNMKGRLEVLFADLNKSLGRSKKELKPPIETLFDDVYDKIPASLAKQKKELMEHIERNKEVYERDFKLQTFQKAN